jgi:hypothetical protein
MPLSIWSGLLLAASTLGGFFAGYFYKPAEFKVRLAAICPCLVVLVALCVFPPPLPAQWEGYGMALTILGSTLMMGFMVLGLFVAGLLRGRFADAPMKDSTVYWND